MTDPVKRIAMWSGPRNISTAMMRSWENRDDTAVVDEPFYACYLTASGVEHPMQKEILADQSSLWTDVISNELQKSLENGQQIQYQKHMTHHMIGELDQKWFASLAHIFLIRHPAEVLMSYSQKRESVNALDLGFARQYELYQTAVKLGANPPILDTSDILQNPAKLLRKLCTKIGVSFDQNMLNWPAGKRDSDGVWAPHWYANVEKSTCFAPYEKKIISLTTDAQLVVDQCMPYYQTMFDKRIIA